MCKKTLGRGRIFILIIIIILFVFGGPAFGQGLPAAQCDLNDDATTNSLDLYQIIGLLGTASGTVNYREGLDLVPDGMIDISDYFALIGSGCYALTGISTSPTSLSGRVFDGIGNPLEGVTVQIGAGIAASQTDALGGYQLDIPSGGSGDTVITFDGSTAVDPTPFVLSGQYPTIPNKPVFINGGTSQVFRDMSLPERDLNGAVTLDSTNSIPGPVANSHILTADVEYNNGGVNMLIPQGCEITFPSGENPVLSITRFSPSMVPVPMPPGLASSIFVTYQPGGTEVVCPGNGGSQPIVTRFDNIDGYTNSQIPVDPDDPDQPFLAGVVNGVFTKLAVATVLNADGTPSTPGVVGSILEAAVTTPFDFAWYHVDVPVMPCPRTTVIGQVVEFGVGPVAGAFVSIPGAIVAVTDGTGNFSIPNVPAGPNGPNCFTNSFFLPISATNAFVGTKTAQAVPGGITDAGQIIVGAGGTVRGRVEKLFSIDDPLTLIQEPLSVVPLPNADVFIGFTNQLTDAGGNYQFDQVPLGSYTLQATFAPEGFFDTVSDQIDFPNDIDTHNFRFVGSGALEVSVVDLFGNPIPSIQVRLLTPGVALTGGFQQMQISLDQNTDVSGITTFGGVPLGPCTAGVVNNLGIIIASTACFINQHNELEQVTIAVDINTVPPPPSNCTIESDNFTNGNGGFELNDFTGYGVTGDAAVLQNLGALLPIQGNSMAFFSTGGSAVGGTTSTITTDPFLVPAGAQKLVVCFNFLSNEVPGFVGSIFDDSLVATLNTKVGAQQQLLASVNGSFYFDALQAQTGYNAQTGWLEVEFDVSAFAGSPSPCTLTLDLNVFDQGDAVFDSAGLVDHIHFR